MNIQRNLTIQTTVRALAFFLIAILLAGTWPIAAQAQSL